MNIYECQVQGQMMYSATLKLCSLWEFCVSLALSTVLVGVCVLLREWRFIMNDEWRGKNVIHCTQWKTTNSLDNSRTIGVLYSEAHRTSETNSVLLFDVVCNKNCIDAFLRCTQIPSAINTKQAIPTNEIDLVWEVSKDFCVCVCVSLERK